MNSRITITGSIAGEYDNISDPTLDPTGSASTGSNDPAALTDASMQENDPVGDDPTMSNPAASASASAAAAPRNNGPSEQERIAELRAILPDLSTEEYRQMLRESDRASEMTRQSAADERMAAAAHSAVASVNNSGSSDRNLGGSRPSLSHSLSNRGSTRSTGSRRSRRSWVPCQPAPSRPGVFSVGGPIERGGTFNVGVTDEMELEIKRIEAVSQVQEALNDKLGYNLRESGRYEEMETMYQEGERVLASTGLERREKKVLPAMMMWDAPPASRKSMMKKEPAPPKPGDPLPLPLAFGGGDDGNGGGAGSNSEICLGKFVDTGPDEDEDEQKREDASENSSWNDVGVDSSPMGPYDRVVRCWECRAGLRVHMEVGLVACPRCRTISPATDIANIG